MVLWTIENCKGGEIFVPKIPSYRITDLAEAVCPDCRQQLIGIRPGEKIHEEMITTSDSFNTIDLGRYFAILSTAGKYSPEHYCDETGCRMLPKGFAYNSGTNPDFLSIEQLRQLIRINVDPNFAV